MGCCYSRDDRNMTPKQLGEHQDSLAQIQKNYNMTPEKRNREDLKNSGAGTGGQVSAERDLSPDIANKQQMAPGQKPKVIREEEEIPLHITTKNDQAFDMPHEMVFTTREEPLYDKQATQVIEMKMHHVPLQQQDQLEEVKELGYQREGDSMSSSQVRNALEGEQSIEESQSKSQQSPIVSKNEEVVVNTEKESISPVNESSSPIKESTQTNVVEEVNDAGEVEKAEVAAEVVEEAEVAAHVEEAKVAAEVKKADDAAEVDQEEQKQAPESPSTPQKKDKSEGSSVREEEKDQVDDESLQKTEVQNQRKLIAELEPVNVENTHKRYQGYVSVNDTNMEVVLELAIDKAPAELVQGNKTNEPTATISGRINHESLEFELLVNYENHSEKLDGKFKDDLLEQMDGVVYNETAGFKKEDGNPIVLTSVN